MSPRVYACIWILLLAALTAAGKTDLQAEYRVKAAVLLNLARFAQWPGDAFATAESELTLGIVGEDPFGGALDEVLRGQVAQGRPVRLVRMSRAGALKACHVLFVSRSEAQHLPEVLRRLGGAPVLTVGDHGQFAHRGGMVNLILRQERVRFEINRAALERCHLRISSKVLQHATLVSEATPPTSP